MAKIRVLVIDDSALIRQMLTEILNSRDDIEVVGTAADPFIAREKIKQLSPDVLTLDIEMPKMTGLQFLQNLMRLRPMRVIMVSTLTERGAPETLEALELGAVDYICKPKAKTATKLRIFADDLVDKVRMAASARVRPFEHNKVVQTSIAKDVNFSRVIVIGSSTGGTEAIKELLTSVPANCPPILITQHIPKVFSASFAERLDRALAMEVFEAQEGMIIRPGCVYIAPGDFHLTIGTSGSKKVCRLIQTEKINRHRPAVDVMFDSILEAYGSKVVAVMLTGMGADGANGMLKLKQAGAVTYAQDEATSVVWGMPQAAYNIGAVDEVLPLQKIPERMLKSAQLK
ncbi:chemotaxis response regulator protein-glutamate methylesterase [Oleispira antarctica]|uniref:Protein-glutamate methylesterase/protein-glutamine glutaminase n=1 Tax=Oleispira antarctica TaxID=188908 RepID=A0A1Y5HPR4_OLEAN|nr:chemotaxis response regulator protein-glutamate methylesterase [Oleispira antarctica]